MINVKVLTLKGEGIPEPLRQIPDPPKQLFVIGNIAAVIEKPRLAVIGSRKVSPYGKQITSQLAGAAASKGVVIVSGLALGVDAIAHQAALDSGGLTVAVLGSGLDIIAPVTNHHLAQAILAKGGAIVSEYPPGTSPLPANFIARNRLVSGLSDAVLITEAAERSGTLHTANFALDQGRTVMAVPGNITSPYSVGTNNLIKTGALPVTRAEDIFEAMNLDTLVSQTEIFAENESELTILGLLQAGLSDSAELQQRSQLDAALFNQTLTMLEITGRIKPLGGGHWALKQ